MIGESPKWLRFFQSINHRQSSIINLPKLEPILRPGSIAVIGASRSADTVGHEIVANLIRHDFAGAVHSVNPHATSIHSIRACPSVSAIPDPGDLAVIAIRKQFLWWTPHANAWPGNDSGSLLVGEFTAAELAAMRS